MIFYFGFFPLAGCVPWLSSLSIAGNPLMTIFSRWCRNSKLKCSTSNGKISSSTELYANSRRSLHWLVAVLFTMSALSMTACRTSRSNVQTSTSLRVQNVRPDQVRLISGHWSLPANLIHEWTAAGVPVSMVDTASKVGVRISSAEGDSLILEPFAFVPSPVSVPDIELSYDSEVSASQKGADPDIRFLLVCLACFALLIVFARRC